MISLAIGISREACSSKRGLTLTHSPGEWVKVRPRFEEHASRLIPIANEIIQEVNRLQILETHFCACSRLDKCRAPPDRQRGLRCSELAGDSDNRLSGDSGLLGC